MTGEPINDPYRPRTRRTGPQDAYAELSMGAPDLKAALSNSRQHGPFEMTGAIFYYTDNAIELERIKKAPTSADMVETSTTNMTDAIRSP